MTLSWLLMLIYPYFVSANIKSAKDLFTFSIGDLQKVTQLSIPDIYDLQKAAAAALQKHPALTGIAICNYFCNCILETKSKFRDSHNNLPLQCLSLTPKYCKG